VQIMNFRNIFLIFFLVIFGNNLSSYADEQDKESTVFMGLTIGNENQMVPYFLNSIEKLDYQKSQIDLQINILNNDLQVKELVNNWIERNKKYFRSLVVKDDASLFSDQQTYIERNKIIGEIKENFLRECEKHHSDFCFILGSDVYLAPHTLKNLIKLNKSIVSPLIRPVPHANDVNRNFFADVTDNGYYKHHSTYDSIAARSKTGTFNVPCVHRVYLINANYLKKVSFVKGFRDYEFLSFSNSARDNHVDQFICNEREFGFYLHLYDEKEEKNFKLKNPEIEITPEVLHTLFSPYYKNDPDFKKYIDNFKLDEYLIYRVQNEDLFYIDEVKDYIKHYIIKPGSKFEAHFHDLFKKYVKPDSTVLDIGAHIGTHTLYLSQIVGDEGSVFAFEPQNKIFTELVINMYLNQLKNVKMFHNALGTEDKWIEMYLPEEEWTKKIGSDLINEGHGTVKEATDNQEGDRALMIKLDDLHLNNVSFIKMDVEGFETEVIKGGLETIKRNKPVMIIEIFKGDELKRKIQEVENLGYISSSIGMDDYLFIPIESLNLSNNANKALSSLDNSSESSESSNESNTNEEPIVVAWEGSFMDLGSLSFVNRAFTEALRTIPGIDLSCISSNKLDPKLSALPEMQQMLKNLKEKAPANTQVTVRHNWPPNWQAPAKGKWVIIQPWEFGSLPTEWVENIKKVDEVWAPTNFVKKEYTDSGVPSEKIFVIPNGVNPKIFNPTAPPLQLATQKKYKFLFVAATIRRKGPDLLIQSYTQNFTADDDVCLVIKDFGSSSVYAGQTAQNIIQEAQKIAGGPEILYLNEDFSLEQIASLYTACDCLVHPYRGEGFGLPIIEAMACGLPVIVTANGAADDFVKPEFGWHIPSVKTSIGNQIEHLSLVSDGRILEPDVNILSMYMRWVFKNPEQAKQKGVVASQEILKNWTWEKAAALGAQRLKCLIDKETEKQIQLVNFDERCSAIR